MPRIDGRTVRFLLRLFATLNEAIACHQCQDGADLYCPDLSGCNCSAMRSYGCHQKPDTAKRANAFAQAAFPVHVLMRRRKHVQQATR